MVVHSGCRLKLAGWEPAASGISSVAWSKTDALSAWAAAGPTKVFQLLAETKTDSWEKHHHHYHTPFFAGGPPATITWWDSTHQTNSQTSQSATHWLNAVMPCGARKLNLTELSESIDWSRRRHGHTCIWTWPLFYAYMQANGMVWSCHADPAQYVCTCPVDINLGWALVWQTNIHTYIHRAHAHYITFINLCKFIVSVTEHIRSDHTILTKLVVA